MKPLIQHRQPLASYSGELMGYTTWKDGEGLQGWPHRHLYEIPKTAKLTEEDYRMLYTVAAYMQKIDDSPRCGQDLISLAGKLRAIIEANQ